MLFPGNSIKPNSIVMLNVIRELCNEPDFQERLDSVLQRISDIESLGRTRELLWKSVCPSPTSVFSLWFCRGISGGFFFFFQFLLTIMCVDL
jgi:hypothetical protein